MYPYSNNETHHKVSGIYSIPRCEINPIPAIIRLMTSCKTAMVTPLTWWHNLLAQTELMHVGLWTKKSNLFFGVHLEPTLHIFSRLDMLKCAQCAWYSNSFSTGFSAEYFGARKNHGSWLTMIWLVVEPYPSEKWWSSSVGMMKFPIYGTLPNTSILVGEYPMNHHESPSWNTNHQPVILEFIVGPPIKLVHPV